MPSWSAHSVQETFSSQEIAKTSSSHPKATQQSAQIFGKGREGSKCVWKWSLDTNSFSAVSHNCKSKHSSNIHRQKLYQGRQYHATDEFSATCRHLGLALAQHCPEVRHAHPSCQKSQRATSSNHGIQSSIPPVSSKTWTTLPCVTSPPALLEKAKHNICPIQLTVSARGPSCRCSCNRPLPGSTFWAGTTAWLPQAIPFCLPEPQCLCPCARVLLENSERFQLDLSQVKLRGKCQQDVK